MSRYIEADGGLWRLSDASYLRMLKMVKEGKAFAVDLDKLGKYVGEHKKFADILAGNITN